MVRNAPKRRRAAPREENHGAEARGDAGREPMKREVQIFIIPKERVPGGPPRPAPSVEVQAATTDGLLTAAREAVATPGRRVRSVSFTPKGLVAYVEETA